VIDQDPLDDSIDRTVRNMTHVAADDDGVARVMARLREADTDTRGYRTLAPRLAWAAAAALVLVAITAMYSLRSPVPDTHVPRIAQRAPAPSTSSAPSSQADSSLPQHPQTVRETPTPAVRAASTVHATTVARDVEPERPLESDLEIASITPAPLGDAPAIDVEPLTTPSLEVGTIPLPSIEMPPVSPERQK
jgi:hypothetical protein